MRKLRTPNLNEFVENGAVSAGLQGVFPTVTYPSHTTLVTGQSPAAHGILANLYFDPEHKMNSAWYWYAEQIRVPALWDAAHHRGLKTAGVSWPVTVGAQIDFNIPEFRFPRTIEDKLLLRLASTKGLLEEFEKVDGEVPMAGQDDHLRARMAAFLFRTRKPDLLVLHLMDFDHAQHGDGPDSEAAFKTLESIDECVGLVRKEVRNSGAASETVFFLVSDHGFRPVEKAFHPGAVLASLGLSALEQKPAEWRVGLMREAGSFALLARDPNDREAIDRATKTFERLQAEGSWGIDRVIQRRELDSLKAFTGAFAAVSLSSGYTTGFATEGPWITPSGSTKGTHGYLPGPVEMDASFLAFGPGIAAARLPRARLVDVAPTAAEILGITLPDAEGRNILPSIKSANGE